MPRRKSLILLVFFMQKVFDFIAPMYYIRSMKGNTEKDMTKFVNKITEEVELDEKVKEYKGIAYFKDRKDAEEHMKNLHQKEELLNMKEVMLFKLELLAHTLTNLEKMSTS